MPIITVTILRHQSWMYLDGDHDVLYSHIGDPLFPWFLLYDNKARRTRRFQALLEDDTPATIQIQLEGLGWQLLQIAGQANGEQHLYGAPPVDRERLELAYAFAPLQI